MAAADGLAPALEKDGGHGRKDGLAWVVFGREGEQMEQRGGPGTALSSWPMAHPGRGAWVAAATARAASMEGVGLSTPFVGVE